MAQQGSGGVAKVGIIVGIAIWLVFAVLAELGVLTDYTWALGLGIIFGVVGLPYAVWVAKKDAGDTAPSDAAH